MNISNLFSSESDGDRAVSPVIGVILMVAITVILAAVIATFVLGLGESVSDSAPQASFDFDYDDSADEVTITHQSGETIDGDRLSLSGAVTDDLWTGTDVGAGDSHDVSIGTDNGGNTLSVTWTSEEGDNSATLSESTIPDGFNSS